MTDCPLGWTTSVSLQAACHKGVLAELLSKQILKMALGPHVDPWNASPLVVLLDALNCVRGEATARCDNEAAHDRWLPELDLLTQGHDIVEAHRPRLPVLALNDDPRPRGARERIHGHALDGDVPAAVGGGWSS